MALLTKDVAAFKKTYRKTNSIKESALAAGYAPSVAAMGIYAMPKAVVKFVEKKRRSANKFMALARAIDEKQQEDLLRGRLFSNVIEGKDLAVQSTRLGMQDKRVSMLQSDVSVGIIVVQPPAGVMDELQRRLQARTEPTVIEGKPSDTSNQSS